MAKSLIAVFSHYSKMRFAGGNSQHCSGMRFISDGPLWILTDQRQCFSQPQSCLNLKISTDYKETLFLLFLYLVSL